MAQKKRNRAAEAAAMLAVTSMSSEKISALGNDEKKSLINDLVQQKSDEEIEKQHDVEIAEAKKLGIDDTLVIESTKNEISKDFEKKLEESQVRYLEAVDDKKKAEAENSKLNKKILELSSQLDLLKTDSSREIANYRIEIDDLNEAVSIYKANESNYKAEIAALKSELAKLEDSLEDANRIINRKMPNLNVKNPSTNSPPLKKKTKGMPTPTNGYDSWN